MKLPKEENFESIYLFCFPKLIAYLQQHTHSLQDAEDIASRAMTILWRKWDTLESHTQRGMMHWLTATAHNLLKEENKKQKRTPDVISLEDLPLHLHPEAPPESDPIREEEEFLRELHQLSEQLPPTEAQLLYDKIVRHLSNEEIAAQLNVSANTIHIRWTRTKKHIAQIKFKSGSPPSH